MNDVEEEEEEQEIAHSSIFILLCWKSVSMYVVLCFCLFFFSFHFIRIGFLCLLNFYIFVTYLFCFLLFLSSILSV